MLESQMSFHNSALAELETRRERYRALDRRIDDEEADLQLRYDFMKQRQDMLESREKNHAHCEHIISDAEDALVKRVTDLQFGQQLIEWSRGHHHYTPFYLGDGYQLVVYQIEEGQRKPGDAIDSNMKSCALW